MKIAVACSGENISEHFGHCENFRFYTIEAGKIVNEVSIDNPGHSGHGSLPEFISQNGADVVISGGMGNGALSGLQARNIEVIIGGSGPASNVVNDYLQGKLLPAGSMCHHHNHEHGHEHGHHHGHGAHQCQCSAKHSNN